MNSHRVLVLAFLALVGCEAPRKLVIADHDRTEEVLAALYKLERLAGCHFFNEVSVAADIKRRRPPFGTVYVRFVGGGNRKLKGSDGRAHWGLTKGRCRLYIGPECGDACMAHELLHCVGARHVSDEAHVLNPIAGWNGMQDVQSYCVEADAQP